MTESIGTLRGFAQIEEMGKAIPWLAQMSAILRQAFTNPSYSNWTGIEYFLAQGWSYQHYYSKAIAALLVDMHQSENTLLRAKELYVQTLNANLTLSALVTGTCTHADSELTFLSQAERLLPRRFVQFTDDEVPDDIIIERMIRQYQINAIYTRVCLESLLLLGIEPALCDSLSSCAEQYGLALLRHDLGLPGEPTANDALCAFRVAQTRLFQM